MKKLKFSYERKLQFENEVVGHYFSLRCIPFQNEKQQIDSLQFKRSPLVNPFHSMDCFGNHLYIGCIPEPHNHFDFCVEGKAIIHKGPCKDENLVSLFKYPSLYTQLEGELEKYYASLTLPAADRALEQAIFLMNSLSAQISYQPKCTDVHTTAAEAFHVGKGVCQDYSHILLALCRKAKIPARYVVGFMMGEGETHAWVEVYDKGLWYGLDPTQNVEVDDNYIKLAIGRDYGDCNIDKGLFYGCTQQKQEIKVRVETCYD